MWSGKKINRMSRMRSQKRGFSLHLTKHQAKPHRVKDAWMCCEGDTEILQGAKDGKSLHRDNTTCQKASGVRGNWICGEVWVKAHKMLRKVSGTELSLTKYLLPVMFLLLLCQWHQQLFIFLQNPMSQIHFMTLLQMRKLNYGHY